MRTVGAYEAKTHLPRLLDEVARGESITITKDGVPVAVLVPPQSRRRDVAEVFEELDKLRRSIGPLCGIPIREMLEEGRRF